MMPSGNQLIDRRRLLALGSLAVGTGAPVGIIGTALSHRRDPTLSVVGLGDWQILLLDAGEHRVLLLVGAPPADGLADVQSMMGVFRQRIDIVVGLESSLDEVLSQVESRWNVADVIVVNNQGVRAMTSPVAANQLTMSLKSASLSIRADRPGSWRQSSSPSSTDWMATVQRGQNRIVVATSLGAAENHALRAAVVITPAADPRAIAARLIPEAIAANAGIIDHRVRTMEADEPPTALVRVFRDDVARFRIREHGISLPRWTVSSGRS